MPIPTLRLLRCFFRPSVRPPQPPRSPSCLRTAYYSTTNTTANPDDDDYVASPGKPSERPAHPLLARLAALENATIYSDRHIRARIAALDGWANRRRLSAKIRNSMQLVHGGHLLTDIRVLGDGYALDEEQENAWRRVFFQNYGVDFEEVKGLVGNTGEGDDWGFRLHPTFVQVLDWRANVRSMKPEKRDRTRRRRIALGVNRMIDAWRENPRVFDEGGLQEEYEAVWKEWRAGYHEGY